ncbi:hypothetical protein CPB84DRAFT_1800255 [Gymnopilus junonius]|uniref:Uncharacterized protein n=1 Tax=Gymnopilus junonius TaxID=109634 RepID=A0A9P5N9W8_GYMJU|nr:hypothetical protein CPB84DRAFT_1800255 [Gymnopilus junonius]
MALAEIVSVVVDIVPTISISLGIIDIDIDLGVHTTHASTHKPTSTSSSAQTITPTSATHISVTPTESVTPTSVAPTPATHTSSAITTPSEGFVSTITRPNSVTTSRDRTTFAGSPTVPIPIFTNSTTASPKISEISTGVGSSLSTGSIELSSSKVPPEGARVVFPLTASLDGVPLAAAEGLPTGAPTSENGSVIRTVTGSGTTWFTTIAGASSTTSLGGTSTSNPQRHQGHAKLSPGIIAAIVIALLFILFSFLFFFCCRKKTRRDQDMLVGGGRSFGINAFRRNMRSGLALPIHVRSRNPQRKSIRLPTSPTSPTFLITPMAEARQSIPSVISDGSRTQYDARDSVSSNGSTTDSHHSFESIWPTPATPIGCEESSAFLKPEMLQLDHGSRSSIQYLGVTGNVDEFGSAFSRPTQQVVYVPNSAFRLTTVPIPPIPPLPSSPPPLPPPTSPHTPKNDLKILNPFDPPSPLRLNRSLSTVDVTDPFQDPMDF